MKNCKKYENNSACIREQPVPTRSPTPSLKCAKKNTLVTMYSEIIKRLGANVSGSIDEVECFLAEPLLDYKNGNPFKWWGENNAWFPILALLAKRYLSGTTTSIPSEQLFSQAGIVYEEHQNRMLPQNAETLPFIKGNYTLFGRL